MGKDGKNVAGAEGFRVPSANDDGATKSPLHDPQPTRHNPKSKIQNLKSLAACALSGLLLVACFPRIHLRGLVWIACFPLLASLAKEKRLKQALLKGYVCGAVFFAGSCSWFLVVMESYGHLAPALAVVVLVLFVIVDSVFFGAFGLAMGWAARRSAGWALLASPFLWLAMELARTYLLTGFPWNLLGYAVQAAGIRQIASVTGVYGLSFLAVSISALLAWVWVSIGLGKGGASVPSPQHSSTALPSDATGRSTTPPSPVRAWSARLKPRISAALGLAIGLGFLAIAEWKLAPPPDPQGRELAFLVQPNVPLDDNELESWIPWHDPTQLQKLVQFSVSSVEQYLQRSNGAEPLSTENRQSEIANPPLLIWAENPAPFFFTTDPIFRNAVENMARQVHAFVIVNTIIPMDALGLKITNSAITVDPEGRKVSRYDKIHLVPFGEYVPWWALPGLVHKIIAEVGDFVPGSHYSVAPSPGGGIGVIRLL